MKVYIVYQGAHGKYDIQGVFSSKRKAERYIADNRDYESRVELFNTYIDEFEVDKDFEWDNRTMYYEYACVIEFGRVRLVCDCIPSFECKDGVEGRYFYHYDINDNLTKEDLNKIFMEWIKSNAREG